MKLATLLRDALRGLLERPVTVQYPRERRPVAPGLRGLLTWDPAQCTGCGLCVKDCPANAIELEVLDKAAKRFVMHYAADQCVYCGQCVQSCRFKCLALSPEQWELAQLTREPFQHAYGQPAEAAPAVARVLEPDPEPAG